MASASDITIVRTSTGEASSSSSFTDEQIGDLIDILGVTGATVNIWEGKAASYSSLVDVTEAGASHKAGSLFDHAEKMLAHWRTVQDGEGGGTVGDGPRVKKIVRTS